MSEEFGPGSCSIRATKEMHDIVDAIVDELGDTLSGVGTEVSLAGITQLMKTMSKCEPAIALGLTEQAVLNGLTTLTLMTHMCVGGPMTPKRVHEAIASKQYDELLIPLMDVVRMCYGIMACTIKGHYISDMAGQESMSRHNDTLFKMMSQRLAPLLDKHAN